MKLFLDCEWADVDAQQLVSLALATEDGANRFYAEIHPLPEDPTDFVRQTVYPLLEAGDCAMSPTELTSTLRQFLAAFPGSFVLYDHPRDGKLFRLALNGFGLPEQQTPPLPSIHETLVDRQDIAFLIEHYFATHPEARRHHAGVDAEALRWACMEGTKLLWSKPRMARRP